MTTELWHELKDKQAESLVGGYQCTTGYITELGTKSWNFLFLDNKAHDVTTATASGKRGVFSWGTSELPGAFELAKSVKANNQQVRICYSEYKLSPYSPRDFYLIGIDPIRTLEPGERGASGASARRGIGIY